MSQHGEVDLFGQVVDRVQTAKDRYGVWPITVWEHDSAALDDLEEIRGLIGDAGEAREGCFQKHISEKMQYKLATSVFSPAVASWILNCYAPASGLCFDPFAGGGTRAILAAKHGLRYEGTELRIEEVNAVRARCAQAGVAEQTAIHHCDARRASAVVGKQVGDFLITCPPYYDLEQYNGGPGDLSMAESYDDFLLGIRDVAVEALQVLKPMALAVWVVGLHRSKQGDLLPLNHDVARIHREMGWDFREEVVIYKRNNGALQRIHMFDKGDGCLVRVHEYVLVFRVPAMGAHPHKVLRA